MATVLSRLIVQLPGTPQPRRVSYECAWEIAGEHECLVLSAASLPLSHVNMLLLRAHLSAARFLLPVLNLLRAGHDALTALLPVASRLFSHGRSDLS